MDASEVLVAREGPVLVITINRPQRANALSRDVMARLIEEIIGTDANPEVRAIVITGAGDRVFCAGADLKDMKARDDAGEPFRRPMRDITRNVFEVVQDSRVPTIAALNGTAVAGGLELALACDLRVASETAKVGMPEAKRGMGANFASVMLPRLVPHAIALEMLISGDQMDAATAAKWGLVNAVVPPPAVLSTAIDLARKIAANAPLTVRRIRDIVSRTRDLPVPAALRMDFGPDPYESEDRKEGVRAFVEGRAPEWKGK